MRDLHQSDGHGEIFSIWKDRSSLSEARCSSLPLAVTGNGTVALVCNHFLPRRNLIKINELGEGEPSA